MNQIRTTMKVKRKTISRIFEYKKFSDTYDDVLGRVLDVYDNHIAQRIEDKNKKDEVSPGGIKNDKPSPDKKDSLYRC